MNFSKHILKNGLRVVLTPMKNTQTVAIEILVEAGSKYENRSNNGVSHFLEHMMFKGTKKRPTTKIIAETFDSVGGEYNAFTGKEQTGYWVKVPTKHFEMALEVVSDLYLNPLLHQKEIDTERGVILQEAAMSRDTPMRFVWDIFESLLYGNQPAGWNIIGTEKNIKKLKREDFASYMKKMYLPKSTVISIAGNFDEKKALNLIETFFKARKNSSRKKTKKKVIENQSVPALRIHEKKTDQTHLLLGFRGPNMFSPDRHATVLLGTLLGGGMSSRTFINIRERYGLTYYINAGTDMTTDTGYLFVAAGVEHKNLHKATRLILKELKKITQKPVTKKELSKAKEYLKGKTLMSLESTTSVTSFFGDQELFQKKIESHEEIFEKIEKITASDIMKVAKKIIKNNHLNLAIIGPHKDNGKLRKVLKV
ncbi:MAG: pitrilysin family protein [Patescibacteria group bacterium]|nr:pitrilysin family protein [Patescibacteria group bacterium]